jgi:membrane protein YdbS with pleckstrin-like domain
MSTPPTFSIKPIFVGWIVLLQQLPIQLIATIWGGLFFGGMLGTFFRPSDTNELSGSGILVVGGLLFIAVPLIAWFGKKLNYDRTEYRFYDDRLEFNEGFITLQKKVVKYRDVKEVSLRRGILQRTCGLGTVYLATLATGTSGSGFSANPFRAFGFGRASASGVLVQDIRDSDTVFEQVRKLVDVDA